jgi:hypothetical protein
MVTEMEMLDLVQQYFDNVTENEIKRDVAFIDSLGFEGISLEDYLAELNRETVNNIECLNE